MNKNFYKLTNKEMEVLNLIVTGKTNIQISNKLGISPNTIKTHISNILVKMNVNGRLQAVIKAIKENLIKID